MNHIGVEMSHCFNHGAVSVDFHSHSRYLYHSLRCQNYGFKLIKICMTVLLVYLGYIFIVIINKDADPEIGHGGAQL